MRFALAIIIGTMISVSAFSEECRNPNNCSKGGQSTGEAAWDKNLTTYDIGNASFYDFGLPDDNQVSPPTYSDSNAAPPAYPFGNSVKLRNGVSCARDGVTVSCK